MLADDHMAIGIVHIATVATQLVVVAAKTNLLTAIGISAEQ